MELVALVAVLTNNLVRINLEWVSESNASTSFDELDGHRKIVALNALFADSSIAYNTGRIAVSVELPYYTAMPTPEQQKAYTQLSSRLQTIGQIHSKSLPAGTVSLTVSVENRKVVLKAYDQGGKELPTAPSGSLKADLDGSFLNAKFPSDEPVIAIISNPMRFQPLR